MKLFEAVKEAVTAREAAERYGLQVSRNGMAVCPFHHDKNPSMKLDQRYYCFGCQATGDVIDFVSKYLEITVKDAAENLADDFGVQYESQISRPRARDKNDKKEKTLDQFFQEEQTRYFLVYSDYYHLLKKWKTQYAPKIEDDDFHPLFCEVMEKFSIIEYKMDVLLHGSLMDRASLIVECREEVSRLEQRIKKAVAEGDGISSGGT